MPASTREQGSRVPPQRVPQCSPTASTPSPRPLPLKPHAPPSAASQTWPVSTGHLADAEGEEATARADDDVEEDDVPAKAAPLTTSEEMQHQLLQQQVQQN